MLRRCALTEKLQKRPPQRSTVYKNVAGIKSTCVPRLSLSCPHEYAMITCVASANHKTHFVYVILEREKMSLLSIRMSTPSCQKKSAEQQATRPLQSERRWVAYATKHKIKIGFATLQSISSIFAELHSLWLQHDHNCTTIKMRFAVVGCFRHLHFLRE